MMRNRILIPVFGFFGFFLLFFALFSLPVLADDSHRYQRHQNVVVKLSSFNTLTWEDPVSGGHNWQPVCMAMMMSDHMLGKQKSNGAYQNDVTLFLNLEAVELADTDTAVDLSGFMCGHHSLQENWDALLHKRRGYCRLPGLCSHWRDYA